MVPLTHPEFLFHEFKLGEVVSSMSKVPFNRPSIIGREVEYIRDCIDRGQLSGDGHYTHLCTARIIELTQSRDALLTHSCTAALEMAAILADLGPGDEVILPSYTFVSTANAVVLRGATPVFVDIDPKTLNIDPVQAEAAVTPRTRAIIAVHYAGFAADMDPLRAICDTHGLMLIEDAAQALGATYKGRKCGSLGDMATFSFHETKNVISGEGGALTLNRADLYERAQIIREKGTNRTNFLKGQVDKYTWVDIGSSFLPGELVAAYLYAQLEHANEINRRRSAMFDTYWTAFADLANTGRIERPRLPEHSVGNGHMFYLLMQNTRDRDDFITHMTSHGINTPFHYVPLHSAPAGRRFGRTFRGSLPVTDDISSRLVRLPMYYDLPERLDEVIDATLDYFAHEAMPLRLVGGRHSTR